MKLKLTIRKEASKVWSWTWREGRKTVSGGLCRTKKAAASDAAIWFKAHKDD